MAWTTPGTAVSGEVLTAAFWNEQVRDNLAVLSPLRELLSYGTNEVATEQTRSNATYGDLATVGPTVTLTTGTAALVIWTTGIVLGDVNREANVSVAISGATTRSATNDYRLIFSVNGASGVSGFSYTHLFTDLTPGSNTFTLKYATSGLCSFFRRKLVVISLPV